MIEDNEKQAVKTLQWYNQSPGLYRTYLQNHFLRLKGKENPIEDFIKCYLQSQEQLRQLITQENNQEQQTNEEKLYIQTIKRLSQQVDAAQKSIEQTKAKIDVKVHEQRLMRRMLKLQLQNYKKAYISFMKTVPNQTLLSSELQDSVFFGIDLINLQNFADKKLFTAIQTAVKQHNQEVKYQETKQEYESAKQELDKKVKINEIRDLIQKEQFQKDVQNIYQQKQKTINQIKTTQQQTKEIQKEMAEQLAVYSLKEAQNKKLKEEINRIRLRISDEIPLVLEQPLELAQQPKQIENVLPQAKENKIVFFKEHNPFYLRLFLLSWLILLLVSGLMINLY